LGEETQENDKRRKRMKKRKTKEDNEKERGLKSAPKQNSWQHLCLFARLT